MEALVHKGAHLLAETGDGLVPRRLLLQQPRAFEVQPPYGEEQRERGERDHAEEQNQHGIIAGHAAVDLRRLIPDAALRRGAQGGEEAEIGPAEAEEKQGIQHLKAQVQQPLDDLPMAKAPCAHHQCGQARPAVSAPEDAGGAFSPVLHVNPPLFKGEGLPRPAKQPFRCVTAP